MTAGWDEIELHGASLRLVMLPDKGAEIISLLDRATEIELLARLRPTPRNDGTINAHGNEFDRWYAGGWQLIIPNGDRACRVDDVEHPFHGEAWARSFEVTSLSATEASLTVELATLPLRIDRRVTVDEVDPLVTVTTTVTNTGERPARVLWGEHPAFGGPVLGEGARLQLPPCLVESASVDSR